jgi:hypothetical protein
MAVEKVTFTLPTELIQRLAKIPAGKRSMLVKDALERELARRSAVSALKRLRGKTIWKARHHRDLQSVEDFGSYRPVRSRVTG